MVATARELTFAQAVGDGLACAMREDPRVWIFGEDVAAGGAYGASQGLLAEFGPARVRDTPISEIAIAGFAVGAAMTGTRPVPEIMHMDFAACAMDQLVNQMAKMRYMVGGKTSVPVRWKGADDLASLAGRPVRFRFHLRHGGLFAFWVSRDATGASHGYVAAGGPGFTGATDTIGSGKHE